MGKVILILGCFFLYLSCPAIGLAETERHSLLVQNEIFLTGNLEAQFEVTRIRLGDDVWRELKIQGKEHGKNIQPLSQKLRDAFICVFPLNNDLLSIWESGSGVVVRLYGFEGGEFKGLAEIGCKGRPEICDIDNDGSAEILITKTAFLFDGAGKPTQYPVEAEIYKKGKGEYFLLKTVPWKTRFFAVDGSK